MIPSLSHILFGERFERNLDLLTAAVVCLGTFVAYATGLFAVEGGVIVLPGDATVVGVIAAASIGYRRSSLIGACATLFAAYIGFHAEWAFLGLSSHSLAGKIAFLLDPVSIGVFVVATLVLGTASFTAGYFASVGIERIRSSGTDS